MCMHTCVHTENVTFFGSAPSPPKYFGGGGGWRCRGHAKREEGEGEEGVFQVVLVRY